MQDKMMIEPLPRVADLMALVLSLKDENAIKKRLVNTILRARGAQSCVADLTLAQNTCEVIDQLSTIRSDLSPFSQLVIEYALLVNAIILYARATHSGGKGGERGAISIRAQLDAERQTDHDEIVEIRNRALAHVHANEAVGDNLWHTETVFAVEEFPGWRPAVVTRRVQISPDTVEKVRMLIPYAEKLIVATYHKLLGEVWDLLAQDSDLLALLERHQLDPVQMFGSANEARTALGGRRSGRNVGIIPKGLANDEVGVTTADNSDQSFSISRR
jgi:hypothetical protein